ncbi:MAG: hypothetical protein ACRD6U_08645 [Nitrososphaeraceae archaeon]
MLKKLTYLLFFLSMLTIASTIGIGLIDTNENNKVFAQDQQQHQQNNKKHLMIHTW